MKNEPGILMMKRTKPRDVVRIGIKIICSETVPTEDDYHLQLPEASPAFELQHTTDKVGKQVWVHKGSTF